MRTKKDPEVTNVSHNTRKFVHETTVKNKLYTQSKLHATNIITIEYE